MYVILCVTGVLWLACSAVFILAIAAAASKTTPKPAGSAQGETLVLEQAA